MSSYGALAIEVNELKEQVIKMLPDAEFRMKKIEQDFGGIKSSLPYVNLVKDPANINAGDFVEYTPAGDVDIQTFNKNELPADTPLLIKEAFIEMSDGCCKRPDGRIIRIVTSEDYNELGHVGLSLSRVGFINGKHTFGAELFFDEKDGKVIPNRVITRHDFINWSHPSYWHLKADTRVWLFRPFLIASHTYVEGSVTPASV